jgi:O-antigen/teichoic acid export membrane protein
MVETVRTETTKVLSVTQNAGVASPNPYVKSTNPVTMVMQSIGAKVFIIVINAATGILCARALQPAGRGELAVMILWPVFLASTLTLGVPSALTFQLRNHPEKRARLLGAALLLATLTGICGLILGLLFMYSWIPRYSARVILFARIFLLNTPVSAIVLVGRAALESRGDFKTSNKLLLASPALTLCCLGILWATKTLTPFTAALSYVSSGIGPFFWMMSHLRELFRPSLSSFWQSTRQLLKYGIRAYGIDLCGTMSLYIDQALVVRLLQPEMMGTYVVALTLSRMLNVFHGAVVMVLFPTAVGRPPSEVREMTSRAARMSTLLTAMAATGAAYFGPSLLSLLYGREYVGATKALRILAIEAVLSGATLVLSQAFMALERPGVITALQLTGLLLTLPLMFVLVPRFGIAGAGLALLVSTSCRLLFVLSSFPLLLKMRTPNIIPHFEDIEFMARAASGVFGSFRKRLTPVEGTD